ncbi:MAG: PHP domain-containing protein, partial [Verrucomicrobiota bacterium]|nr:PHP domain-containing protein [Verrucomicrobiota bacterium]
MTNAAIGEMLAIAAQKETGVRQKAFRRAARSHLLWPEEAADLLASDRSLTELQSVGPFLASEIARWLEEPPARRRARDPLRRDFLTLAEARRILATDPSWSTRIRGDLQMHSNWSDGSGRVSEMAQAASALEYEYIAITDHAKGLKIAGGIDETQLAEQAREIAAVNREQTGQGVTVLQAIELNLNPQGAGDLEPKTLAKLDLVLGSFHSALRKDEDQTARYLAALRNPDLHILGHPRGRVFNYRLGLSADWPRVFAEATARDKAVEIDCYPDRQDLNVELLKLARAAGTRVSLGTDAHHPWQLEFIEFGLAAALKAKIPAERIVNFLPLAELRAW